MGMVMGISQHFRKQVGFSPSNFYLLGTSCQQQTKASSPPFQDCFPLVNKVEILKGKIARCPLEEEQ